jgi:ribosomal protein L21E
MQRFTEGDSVRVDIPDETDPDHDVYHGETGEVVAVFEDSVGEVTGDERDNTQYRVRLENGQVVDFRWLDLRPR